METIILFIFLLLCSIWDWKTRTIPVWLCISTATMILLCDCFAREISLEKMGTGILVGIFLLFVGKITRGQIGLGDGIAFLVIGMAMGGKESLFLLVESLCILFCFCLVGLLIGKIKMKQKLPFLPFVFIAYVIHLFL